MAPRLTRAMERVRTYTGELPPLIAEVHLVTDPETGLGPGHAATLGGVAGDLVVAQVLLPAPSCIPAAARTRAGGPMDGGYVERTLVHELAGPILSGRTYGKRTGWRFYDAPEWFVQGLEEYVAISTDPDADALWEAMWPIVRAEGGVAGGPGAIVVGDPYVGGLAVVGYLHAAFGRTGVASLFDDSAPTFDKALDRLTGGSDAFFDGWQAWAGDGPDGAPAPPWR